MTEQRYILQPSKLPNKWVCTDTQFLIVCEFEQGNFNDTQKITMLQDFKPKNYMQLATIMRELSEWLSKNHYEKLF